MRCSLMMSIGFVASLGVACGEVEQRPDAGSGQPDASMNVDGGSDVELTIDKTEHDFGTVVTSSSSAATTFTITNIGSAPSGSLAVAIDGDDAGDFSLDTDGCDGAPLAGGASCEIEISYMPAQAGTSAATLTVSGAPGGELSAELTGNAVAPGALMISPTDHGFPAVVVGESGTAAMFTVTNSGGTTTGALSVALTGSDMDQFTIGANDCSGQTLAGSDTCTVAVALTPGSAGSKSASLTVTGAPGGTAVATLSGTGLNSASITMTPISHDFGGVVVGSDATQVFAVTNGGQQSTGTLGVSKTGAADFTITADTCTGQVVAGGGMCAVTVRFAPGSAGAKSGSVTVTGAPGGSDSSTLAGNGLSPGAIVLTPASRDYGDVVVGSDASQVFTVTNSGQQSTGTLAVSKAGAADFTIIADTCNGQVILGGASCAVTVRFAPGSAGAKSGSVAVTGAPGGSDSSSLSGNGLTPALIAMTPASRNYGDVVVGNDASQVFTVTNSGQQSTGTLAVSKTGADFTITADTCNGQVILGGASCAVTVRFAPASAGAKSGSVTVTGAPGGSDSSSLSGNGLSPALIAMTPASRNYGDVVVGNDASQVFTVTNSGQQSTGTLAVSKTGAADFSITADSCDGQVVAGGTSCAVTVRFAPGSAGAKSGAVIVTGSPGGTDSSTLSGNGLSPASIAMTPPSHGYGNVLVGDDASQVFTVTNSGQQATGTLVISKSGAADFTITADTCSGQVVAGLGTCAVTVRFAPGSAGAKSGSIGVTGSPGGSDSSTFSGTGQDPAVLGSGTSSLPFGNHEVAVSSGALTWTITNSGDVPTGTLSLTNTNTTEFATTSTCGSTLAAGASCTVSATFTASTGGARSGMLTMSASPGGSTSVSTTGFGMYRLNVDRTGTGTVTASVAGISCGTDCTELYAPGTAVTLQARTTNGTNMFFDGWSGASCSGWFRDCTVTMNQSRLVGARFSTQTHNLVFVTSTTHPATLGSVDKYDALCNESATAAGINSSNGDGFVAHISSANSPAASRLGNAIGWRRMDGKAFAVNQGTLFESKAVLNPVRFDEHGRDVGDTFAWTGSNSSGSSSGQTCSDWAVTTGNGTVGRTTGGPERWSSGTIASCSSAQRLLCMGNNHYSTLTPAASAGKRIYRTVRPFLIGPNESPDQRCSAEKPQGTGTVKALLAYTTAPASAVLTSTTTYVRPDGQVVGTGARLIDRGPLESGIWQAGDGSYTVSASGRAWTGQTTLTANGTTASTCGDWANPQAGDGHQGYMPFVTALFWDLSAVPCSTTSSIAGYLYCVEQ